MKQLQEQKEPIGAVVKKMDVMFSHLVRKTKNNGSFNRVEWLYLNEINVKQTIAPANAVDYLKYFISAKEAGLLMKRFLDEGLVQETENMFSLTELGKSVHSELFQIQETIKVKAEEGLTTSDFDNAIKTLKRIEENLKEFVEYPAPTESYAIKTMDGKQLAESEVESIKKVITILEEAFNEKDAKKFVAIFDEDVTFVNATGRRVNGKDALYQAAVNVFSGFLANSYAKFEIESIRFIKDDIALVSINQTPVDKSGNALGQEAGGRPTYLMGNAENSGEWKILAGQNTLVMQE